VSIGNVSVVEGDSGTTPAAFTVSLSAPCSDPVTVNWATADGTATAGTDYQAASGTLTFSPGQTALNVSVSVFGNTTPQPNRTFTVALSGPQGVLLGTSQGTGTILDDDSLPVLSISDASVVEGNTGENLVLFTLTVSPWVNHPITVQYDTSDGTATYLGPNPDYIPMHGTLTIDPNVISETFWIETVGDKVVEPDETFFLTLSNPGGATLGRSQATGTILNDDHAPVANAGPDQAANEGDVVHFDGSGSSDADNDPLTYTWNFGDGTTGTGVNPTHAYADNGTYTVTLTASDGANTSTDTLVVTVANVPPTAAVSGPADAVPGQTRAWTFSATDPSSADAGAPFGYTIAWGDGTTQTVLGGGAVSVEHTYTAAGTYTVSATVADKDGGVSAAATQAVSVVAAELQGGDLYVGGTTGDDQITLTPADGGAVTVVLNGQTLGTFTLSVTAPGQGSVVVYGQAGNDTITLAAAADGSGFPYAAALFGGDGNDTLDASLAAGPTVLVGGAGDDLLLGGSGRDILIGGAGTDTLHGGAGEDLLIGGTTAHDASLPALSYLFAEWNRTDADFTTRRQHLSGELAGGLNGGYLLTALTVFDDGSADELFGDGDADWFIAAGGSNADHVNDPLDPDFVTLL
jgi:PKD repeat protein